MCDPTTLTLGAVALGVGGEILGASEQNKASKRNAREARLAEALQINDLSSRETQEKSATSQDTQAADRQTTTALSTARVAAGEAGVSGVSVDALLADIGNEGSAYKETAKVNLNNTIAQLERDKLGAHAQANSRINSQPKANPFAVALRIGQLGLGAATSIYDRRAPSGK